MIRIALAQINPTVGDLKGNAEKILSYAAQAQKNGADIVTFPELSVCGYPPQDLILKTSFIDDCTETLKQISKNIPDGILTILGCVTRDKHGVYNSAALIKNNKIHAVYNKIELPNYGVFDEKRYFTQGSAVPLFKIGETCFSVNICEDIWENRVVETQAKMGAGVTFNLSASPFHAGKHLERLEFIRKKAKKLKMNIFYNNMAGGQDELVFDGNSFSVAKDGKVVLSAGSFNECLVYYDLIEDSKNKAKGKVSVDFGGLAETNKPAIKKSSSKSAEGIEEIHDALIMAARDYINKNCFKKAVIGISGGIDSALTAALVCEAIGTENVIGITMPSVYSSDETKQDSYKLAENLGFKLITIPINKVYDSYMNELAEEFKGLKPNITEENLQARIRGNILMAFSNKFGWLVISTGNKSEISCGYSTLYGDMAGGYNLLKDLYKTVVYELSNYVNKAGKYIIPQSIIDRPPTAELRPNQKDSDSLPPYDVLDAILKLYIEQDMGCKEIIKKCSFEPETVKRVIRLVDTSEFKRRQSCPGIKITERAFDKDRRMPITNKYS